MMRWLVGRYLWWRREGLEARDDGHLWFWLFITLAWLYIAGAVAWAAVWVLVLTWPVGLLVVLGVLAVAWVLCRALLVDSPELDALEREYVPTRDPGPGCSS